MEYQIFSSTAFSLADLLHAKNEEKDLMLIWLIEPDNKVMDNKENYDRSPLESVTLSGIMLLVSIIANNYIVAYLSQVRLSKG